VISPAIPSPTILNFALSDTFAHASGKNFHAALTSSSYAQKPDKHG
jgi:hypothetical protein